MIKNKKRIIHLMTSYGGGISSFIYNKAIIYGNSDLIFDVITFDNVPKEFEEAINATGGVIYNIPNIKNNPILFLKQVDNIFKKAEKDTIIHAHFGMNLGLIFKIIAAKNSINNFVVHAHTNDPKNMNAIKRNINTIISNTKFSCGKQASYNFFTTKTVNNHDVKIIPNSIDSEIYLNQSTDQLGLKTELGISPDIDFVIGHIGRFHEVKNHMFMIQIIEDLVEKNNKFKWIFIGDGDLERKIKKMVTKLNLEEYVIFLGRRNDVPDLLKIMDMIVIPSLYEGLSIVAIEAQASGKFCLLSENVAKEADLGLDLVRYLPIDNYKIWSEAIVNNLNYQTIPKDIRREALSNKGYDNISSAEIYRKYILNSI